MHVPSSHKSGQHVLRAARQGPVLGRHVRPRAVRCSARSDDDTVTPETRRQDPDLALEAEIGALAPGLWGDCLVIRARAGETRSSAEEQVLASGPRDVLATFVGGRDVYRTSPPL